MSGTVTTTLAAMMRAKGCSWCEAPVKKPMATGSVREPLSKVR
jgi:hypothetical protein